MTALLDAPIPTPGSITPAQMQCPVCKGDRYVKLNANAASIQQCYECRGKGSVGAPPISLTSAEEVPLVQAVQYAIVDPADRNKLAIPDAAPAMPFAIDIFWVGPQADIPRTVKRFLSRSHPRAFVRNEEASPDDVALVQIIECQRQELARLKAQLDQAEAEKATLREQNAGLLKLIEPPATSPVPQTKAD